MNLRKTLIKNTKLFLYSESKFIDYANQYGLEAARTKIKDSKLLEQYIKAYCDKFDLDYLSVSKALESVAKVKKVYLYYQNIQ